MLLPPRVGKVLRANSQVLALAREVKALGAGTVTDKERQNERKNDRVRWSDSPASVDPRLAWVPP